MNYSVRELDTLKDVSWFHVKNAFENVVVPMCNELERHVRELNIFIVEHLRHIRFIDIGL